MSVSTLYGWDDATWRRVTAWAGELPPRMWDEGDWPRLLRLREKWLLSGGPVAGPSGLVLMPA